MTKARIPAGVYPALACPATAVDAGREGQKIIIFRMRVKINKIIIKRASLWSKICNL